MIATTPPRAPVPNCFDDEYDYDTWLLHDFTVRNTSLGASSYCEDCTPEYQEQMVEAGRCSHPETSFFMRVLAGGETEMVGLRSVSRQQLKHLKVDDAAPAA